MTLARFSGRFVRQGSRAERRRRAARSGSDEATTPDAPTPGARRERRRLYLTVGVGSFLLAVIFGVVIFGYYWEFFRPPRVWAGSVNNVEFTMNDLVQRIRVLQGVNRYDGGRVNLSTVPFEYLQNLMDAEILRQSAPALGIDPRDEDVEAEIRNRFQPALTGGQEADPGQLEREYRNNYQTFLTATGLTDSEFRVIVEEELTERGLRFLMWNRVESPQEQVEVQWIRLPIDPTETGADTLLPEQISQRLELESFETVAREVSLSAGFADTDGKVGWVPKGAFPDIDPLIFGDPELGAAALNPGEVSRALYSADGIYIIKKLAGPEEREVDDRMRGKLAVELAEDWKDNALQEGLDSDSVKMHFNSSLYEWVADQVFVTAPRVPITSQTGQ